MQGQNGIIASLVLPLLRMVRLRLLCFFAEGVLGDEDAFRESCGDKWEELLTELIILIEDSHAQECFSQCIEAHPIFQQVCTGSNKDVELVSLHLFLKNLGFDITSQYLITN